MTDANLKHVATGLLDLLVNIEEVDVVNERLLISYYNKFSELDVLEKTIPVSDTKADAIKFLNDLAEELFKSTHKIYHKTMQ